MRSPSSTNDKNEIGIGIERFFVLFSSIWKTGVMKRADKIGKRADFWPTSILVLKKGKIKLFQIYWVCLLIK